MLVNDLSKVMMATGILYATLDFSDIIMYKAHCKELPIMR